ncbi:MAG: DUF4276 family protein [Alphaproteobacteria bacterium]|nr:DUF4276 family protein [Alphaproteobacteria bacterium]
MEVGLRQLLPRILRSISFEIYVHQGKLDLLARLPDRLRGYANWLPSTYRVLVVVDRDDDDCGQLKARLDTFARSAGLATRSASRDYRVVNRIAIEELEAWFFGDWAAVHAAFPRLPANVPRNARYRYPDQIAGGTWEQLERLMRRAGYFSGGYRKVEAAAAIAEHMDPDKNRSVSFRQLHAALLELDAGSS